MEWGDDIKAISKDEAVMLVNHQATGDVCTLMMCLQDKGQVSPSPTAGRGGPRRTHPSVFLRLERRLQCVLACSS